MQAATLYAPQLGYATKYAPEIAFLVKNGALVQQASKYPQGAVPPKLQAQLIAAAGGGTTGINLLTTLNTHQKEITSVIASAGALEKLQPYATQLTALSKIPPNVSAYLTAHANDVIKANGEAAGQWKHWWYVCLGGIIFFILSIPLMRGRWSPARRPADEAAHEAMVQAEMEKLGLATEAQEA